MNADLVFCEALADVEAQECLSREFPKLSDRVIVSVLAAYRRKRSTRVGAIQSARRRLRDACAI
jgi:hypothetical protein